MRSILDMRLGALVAAAMPVQFEHDVVSPRRRTRSSSSSASLTSSASKSNSDIDNESLASVSPLRLTSIENDDEHSREDTTSLIQQLHIQCTIPVDDFPPTSPSTPSLFSPHKSKHNAKAEDVA